MDTTIGEVRRGESMSMGLLVWSVLCIGLALLCAAALAEDGERTVIGSGVVGIGLGLLVWAVGLGLWMLVGVIL